MAKCISCNIEVPDNDFCPICGAFCSAGEAEQEVTSDNVLPPGYELKGQYLVQGVIQVGEVNLYRAAFESNQVLAKEMLQGHIPDINQQSLSQESKVLPSPFRAEFELLTSLKHEAYQRAYDYFMEERKEYLVLEQPIGQKLSDFLSQKNLDEDCAIDIAIHLCDAVTPIHQLGYAHLDIIPDNILWDGERLRLFNFGRMAKLGSYKEEYLTTDGYSAPELFAKRQPPVDQRADVYSIGAVLYAMLAGEPPSATESASDIVKDVPEPKLGRILLSCLATKSETGYQTVDELKQKLLTYRSKRKANLQLDTALISDIGMIRYNNEDCGWASDIKVCRESRDVSYGLYMVADGMGGEQAGEVASAKAIEIIRQRTFNALNSTNFPDTPNDVVREAIETANKEIYLLARDAPALSSMGTTITLGLRVGNELYIGHVGDSRAYLMRDGKFTQLTEDHSLVSSLIKAGIITPEEAKVHPGRGKIFRSLGNAPTVFIDHLKEKKLVLKSGDVLLFCTDGLVNFVSDGELLSEVTSAATAHAACSQLVRLADQRGGDDNITVICVRVNAISRE